MKVEKGNPEKKKVKVEKAKEKVKKKTKKEVEGKPQKGGRTSKVERFTQTAIKYLNTEIPVLTPICNTVNIICIKYSNIAIPLLTLVYLTSISLIYFSVPIEFLTAPIGYLNQIIPIIFTASLAYAREFWILVVSCFYVLFMRRPFKKVWFGLAISSFVIALLLVTSLILENPKDKVYGIIINENIPAGSITCASIEDMTCEPYYGRYLFEENRWMICSFEIVPPKEGILANSTYLNTSICPYIAIKHIIWYSEIENVRIGANTSVAKDKDGSKTINDYGGYKAFLKLDLSGYTHILFQLICYNESNIRIRNAFGGNLNQYIENASSVKVEIRTKTNSEADEKRSNRNYQFIISLFALFGIFPAVYYLRNLYRNN